MENQKRSKKVLRNLIQDSMREAISSLQLPQLTKKASKVIDRSSKKLATVFSEILKKEDKKKKKAEKLLKAAVNGDGRKKTKRLKKPSQREHAEPIKL
jgi:hypothetical protein